jgi:hypothetical protein
MSEGIYNGLGNMQTIGNQIVLPAVSTAGSIFGPMLVAKLAWPVPVVGPAIAGITIALAAIFNRKSPRQKEIATQAANEVEQILQNNVAEYMAGPRTPESQAYALMNFDAAWNWLTSPEGCGSPELGDPGRRCISERQRGGSAPWCPTTTGCDWFILYRDPIANDSPAVASPAVTSSAATGGGGDLLSVLGIQPGPGGEQPSMMPLLALGLIGAGLLMS